MINTTFASEFSMYVGLYTKEGLPIRWNKAIDSIEAVMKAAGFDSFTVTETLGFWKGGRERGLMVSVLYGPDTEPGMSPSTLAHELGQLLNQEAVAWKIVELRGALVETA